MKPEKQKNFLIRLLYIAAILLLVLLGAKILLVWLLPFAAGLAVAILLRPAIRKLSRISPLPRKYAAVIVTTLLYLAILGALWFLAVRVIDLAAGLLSSAATALPEFLEQLTPALSKMRARTSRTLDRLSPSLSSRSGAAWKPLRRGYGMGWTSCQGYPLRSLHPDAERPLLLPDCHGLSPCHRLYSSPNSGQRAARCF